MKQGALLCLSPVSPRSRRRLTPPPHADSRRPLPVARRCRPGGEGESVRVEAHRRGDGQSEAESRGARRRQPLSPAAFVLAPGEMDFRRRSSAPDRRRFAGACAWAPELTRPRLSPLIRQIDRLRRQAAERQQQQAAERRAAASGAGPSMTPSASGADIGSADGRGNTPAPSDGPSAAFGAHACLIATPFHRRSP